VFISLLNVIKRVVLIKNIKFSRPRFHDDYSDPYNKPQYYPPSRFPPMEHMEPIVPPAAKAVNPAERTNDCEILIFDRANTYDKLLFIIHYSKYERLLL
jgi:hypothetical protein